MKRIAIGALALGLSTVGGWFGYQHTKQGHGHGGGGGGGGTTSGACFGYSSALIQQVPGALSLDPTKTCWTTTNGLPAWDATAQTSSAVIPQVSAFTPGVTQPLLAIFE